ncbi:MAG TPA: ABC transporter permease [Anaerolineales bacterium]|nr:ABC transporter permease [Anaerolineales bacterium]
MSVESQTVQTQAEEQAELSKGTSTFSRVAKYTAIRIVMLVFTVAVAIFLTIMIANMGGYVDNIMKGEIRQNLVLSLSQDPNYLLMKQSERGPYLDKLVALEEKRLGLDKPFVTRATKYMTDAMVLDLGRALSMTSDEGSKNVRLIILERLPPTLLLMGTSQLLLFFASLFFGLALSRQYGSKWDKFLIAISPTSSAPSWFYGLFLILIFAAVLKVLPFGGMISSPPPQTQWEYILDVSKHLILPASALFISAIAVSIYNSRTFFLIYSSEDYVEMAKAKGLPDRDIERRYILRPTLPTIITNFSLLIIGLWTGAIITETVFSWPGLGQTTFTAIGLYDTPVIVAVTILFAYLLALTVFLLDFIYALVDPRVKVGEGA